MQIDAVQSVLFGPVLLPATGGTGSHFQPLPVSTALVGVPLAGQPLEWRGSRLRLGNCVDTLIGR